MTNEQLVLAAQDGDTTALLALWERIRRLLFQRFRKQAAHILKQYGQDDDDTEQLAFLALLWIVDHYSADKGILISTYTANACWQTLRAELGWRATNPRYRPPPLSSLDEPVTTPDGTGSTLVDLLPDPDAADAFNAAEAVQTQTVRAALEGLPEREQYVVRCRFWVGMTLQQVGDILGVSRERVRQIEAKALATLKNIITDIEGDFEHE